MYQHSLCSDIAKSTPLPRSRQALAVHPRLCSILQPSLHWMCSLAFDGGEQPYISALIFGTDLSYALCLSAEEPALESFA